MRSPTHAGALVVPAALDDAAVIEDQHLVGMAGDRRFGI
jgi:hypothetical protein